MKILSYLNVSNVDDIECDSGYIFNYTIASELSSRGVRVDIIFPSELRGRINKISSDSQHFVEMGHTKYEVRYHFSWNELKRLIELLQPDVIFLNQAELTAHMKALLVEMGLDQAIKIVSYCHYPALHLNDDGIGAFFSGISLNLSLRPSFADLRLISLPAAMKVSLSMMAG